MKKFIIQTINGTIEHDFSFHLRKAIEYNNWFYSEKVYDYIFSDTTTNEKDCIPVGSLEFVFDYIEKNLNINRDTIKPINIPEELNVLPFLQREVNIVSKKDIILSKPAFIKSNTGYKKYTDIIKQNQALQSIPDDEYLVSEVVEIDSEWRIFIHGGNLVGVKNYLGDFKLAPDFVMIEKMIDAYKNSPYSYTLDVGINNKGTFLIEVHPFVSCGLYGFADYKILPQMFIKGYQYLI